MHYQKIPLAGPFITEREVSSVIDAVRNGFYETYDKDIVALEKTFAEYVGANYAIACYCGTHALHLAAIALGLKPGDEVIVADQSFIATAHVISYVGATSIFVDILKDTLCIDPSKIEEAITPHTKAIMVVHFAGFSCDMDKILQIASKHGLRVIEDACQSVGTQYKGRFTGTIGDIGTYSFQGSKIAVGGEGGMFVTNNKELYERARHYGTFCRNDAVDFLWSDDIGYNYRISNVTAALVHVQVQRIDELIANKKRIFDRYWAHLKDHPHFTMLTPPEHCTCNYSYVVGFLNKNAPISRDELLQSLLAHNIHARPGYPSMSLMPHYSRKFPVPVSDLFHQTGMNLPAAHSLTDEDVDTVCEELNVLLKHR